MAMKIAGKGLGRPDFTTDNFVTTLPLVLRHQTRVLTAIVQNDMNFNIGNEGYQYWTSGILFPANIAAGKTFYLMWFGNGISSYRRLEMHACLLDVDKIIESEYLGFPWKPEDLIVEDYGKKGGWGSVTIERGVYSPAVVEYATEPERSAYFPFYVKYMPGTILYVYGEPGESFTVDGWFAISGMVSTYPWWI